MQITFSPVRRDQRPEITRKGDTLIIDGETFDFSGIPEGATLPADAVESDWINGPIERTDGLLHLTLMLSHGAKAPEETRYPEGVSMEADGPVPMPPHSDTEAETPA